MLFFSFTLGLSPDHLDFFFVTLGSNIVLFNPNVLVNLSFRSFLILFIMTTYLNDVTSCRVTLLTVRMSNNVNIVSFG